jgi:uracil-DNA glycosylase
MESPQENTHRIDPRIDESWKNLLLEEFNQPYFIALKQYLVQEKKNHVIYPPGNKIFAAFDRTSFDRVKVVILGQDPYHGKGQAHGLCFSVPQGITAPPSLVNIFKELNQDLGIPIPPHGNLEAWADQGVLLLNATLTVRANQAGSHQNMGWEIFTDAVIKSISEGREGLIFMLWGRYAQAKEHMIDGNRHHILKAAHPSPFSAHSGFFGCRHFSRANEILEKQGMTPIDWSLS